MEPVLHSSSIRLENRERLTVSGVSQVLQLEEDTVLLDTCLGLLSVDGQNLQLKSLEDKTGVVTILGTVEALSYRAAPAGGWFRRLLG